MTITESVQLRDIEDVRLTLMKLSKNNLSATLGGGKNCGPERARTADLLLAKQALYQLSYRPVNAVTLLYPPQNAADCLAAEMVGQRGIAPLTPALSALCSTN